MTGELVRDAVKVLDRCLGEDQDRAVEDWLGAPGHVRYERYRVLGPGRCYSALCWEEADPLLEKFAPDVFTPPTLKFVIGHGKDRKSARRAAIRKLMLGEIVTR